MQGIQKYGSQKRLMENQKYTVSFVLAGEPYTFSFTSRYSPLYSTVKIIRSDYPDLFAELSDDLINFHIWQNSQLVHELLDNTNEQQFFVDNKSTYAIKQYVRYKTEYDIVRGILIALSSKAGAEEKHLAEFKVTREIKTPELDKILDLLKDLINKWEASLGLTIIARGAVRAGRTFPYPLNPRVGF